jgi:hypothetical protein
MQARQPMHDAVAAFEQRVGRADPDAGSLDALVAQDGEEEAACVREGAFLDCLDPASVHADGDLVLSLARDRARVTADALSQIYCKAEICHTAAGL